MHLLNFFQSQHNIYFLKALLSIKISPLNTHDRRRKTSVERSNWKYVSPNCYFLDRLVVDVLCCVGAPAWLLRHFLPLSSTVDSLLRQLIKGGLPFLSDLHEGHFVSNLSYGPCRRTLHA